MMDYSERSIVSTLLDSTPDGIALFDLSMTVVYANSKFCALWNLEASSIIGMPQAVLREHKLAMLMEPEQDASSIYATTGQNLNQETNYIRLISGMWFERLVYDHISEGKCLGHVVQWRDVTKRHSELVFVKTERDLLHRIMDSVPNQIYFKDTESRFTRVNKALAVRFGLTNTDAVIGKSDADFYDASHAAQTRKEELEIMSTLVPQLNKIHHEVWANGNDAWNVSTKMPLFGQKGEILGVFGIAHDITEQKRAESMYMQLANFDTLTNLPNRRLMQDRWNHAVQVHLRSGKLIAMVLIDLDKFKEVNDAKGHVVGDLLLVEASQRMVRSLRGSDTLVRLGGDEFVAIINDISDPKSVVLIANKILANLSAPFELSGNEVLISGSIGVSFFPNDGKEIEQLLQYADSAMYRVKADGGNGVAFYQLE